MVEIGVTGHNGH